MKKNHWKSQTPKTHDDVSKYIIDITEEIWEGNDIPAIQNYYGENCEVITPLGITKGIPAIMDATVATKKIFPDRTLLPENVVVSGSVEKNFLSSHLIVSNMTHEGTSPLYGKPTGRKVCIRTIADCVVRDNKIIHEWLVRDHSALSLQLGIPVKELAKSMIELELFTDSTTAQAIEANKLYPCELEESEEVETVTSLLHTILRTDVSPRAMRVSRAVDCNLPGGLHGFGTAIIDQYAQKLHSGMTCTDLQISHASTSRSKQDCRSLALRFTATAQHLRSGHFGPATNKEFGFFGMIQSELCSEGNIKRFWLLLDEVAIWCDILN